MSRYIGVLGVDAVQK